MKLVLLIVFAVYSAGLLGSSLTLLRGVGSGKSIKMVPFMDSFSYKAEILMSNPNKRGPFLFGYKLTYDYPDDPLATRWLHRLGIRIPDLEDNSAEVVYEGETIKGTWVSKNKGNLTVEFSPPEVEDKFIVSIDVTNEGAELFGRYELLRNGSYLSDREIKITNTTKSEATGNSLEWTVKGREMFHKDDATAKELAEELFPN